MLNMKSRLVILFLKDCSTIATIYNPPKIRLIVSAVCVRFGQRAAAVLDDEEPA